jgi:transposase
MIMASTAQVNRLRALLLAGGDADRHTARSTLTIAALSALARRRPSGDASRAEAIRQAEIRRLAIAVRDAERQLAANRKQLQAVVDDLAPGLTQQYGIGPISAAQAVVSFSRPGRCRNEAAFAALAGTSPLRASSGRTLRHRLNRGGDRALNRAIHTIALTRMRSCARTRAYVARRTAEGRSSREIRRSWAVRYLGRPGAAPHDLDVLVIGQPTRASVYDAADRAQQRLRMPVNPVIRTADTWRNADDPLVRQIQSSPFVSVLEPDDAAAEKARTADE